MRQGEGVECNKEDENASGIWSRCATFLLSRFTGIQHDSQYSFLAACALAGGVVRLAGGGRRCAALVGSVSSHESATFRGGGGHFCGRVARLSTSQGRLDVSPQTLLIPTTQVHSREELSDLLGEADVVLYPSRWEGFGLSMMEALHAGLCTWTLNPQPSSITPQLSLPDPFLSTLNPHPSPLTPQS